MDEEENYDKQDRGNIQDFVTEKTKVQNKEDLKHIEFNLQERRAGKSMPTDCKILLHKCNTF